GPGETQIDVRLDPGRPELLYARVIVSQEGEAYLWRSRDAGATWHNIQANLGRPSMALAIDPADPKVIWIWTFEGELWRSPDAGETWSRRYATPPDDSFDLQVQQLLVDPHDPSTLYRVGYDRRESRSSVDVSHDGGATFLQGAPLSMPYPSVQMGRDGLVAFDDNGLKVSTDGGQTWTLRGSVRDGFFGGQIAPSSPNTMYGLAGNCLTRSDDGGAHWRRLPFPRGIVVPNFGCTLLAVDPKDARHLWVSSLSDLLSRLSESKDGGETWSDPLPLPENDFPLNITAAGGDLLYSSRHVSTDGGRTWTRRDRGITDGDARYGLVSQRLPGRNGGLRLLAIAETFEGSLEALFRSRGRESWRQIPIADAASIIGSGPAVVVEAGAGGVHRSTDGGATWQAVPTGPPQSYGLFASLPEARYLAVQAFEEDTGPYGSVALWTSNDAGLTWRRSSDGLPIECTHFGSVDFCLGFAAYLVDPFDSTRRWVAAGGLFSSAQPLFVSRDGGASWQVLTADRPGILALAADPKVKNRLLAGTFNGLNLSEDGGEHWRPYGNGLPGGARIFQLARDAQSGSWYAVTFEQGIYRSLDDGANWTILPGAPDLEYPAIEVDPRTPGALFAAFRGQGVWLWTP
ncbi:MAG TPA: hypothetical protein VLX28_08345, partial [Thermoanaerobaculia bacterium]|nr:hypothetical protein [Thermoanaerobaculia bacterium]